MVDAFLLHNPERMVEQGVTEDELRMQVAAAFAFLEECVARGRVRFYGVSSNALAAPPLRVLSLEGYLGEARKIHRNHHFRLIEFPCNLLERAALSVVSDAPSLVDRARADGIVTVANRPLNALQNGRLVRLTTYEGENEERDRDDDATLAACVAAIERQLARTGSHHEPRDFEVVRWITDHFVDLDSSEAVDQVFGVFLTAFLRRLYGGAMPRADAALFARLHQLADQGVRYRMGADAAVIRSKLLAEGVIHEDDNRPLQMIACGFRTRRRRRSRACWNA